MDILMGQKNTTFDGSQIVVSVFERVAPAATKAQTPEERALEYARCMRCTKEVSLCEFLNCGAKYMTALQEICNAPDKKTRQELKKRNLAAACLSARLKTRETDVPLSERIAQYNGLIALDFDDVQDIENAKRRIASLPYVWYVGLSASKRGFFAIVPLDNDDYTRHKEYFSALADEVERMGFRIDGACCDVTRLRYVSYDPEPIFNDSCVRFTLPDGYVYKEHSASQKRQVILMEKPELAKATAYVDDWERKGTHLDDYKDWIMVGMALSELGEDGRELFHRVSRTSDKYDERTTDRTFDGFCQKTRDIHLGTFFFKCHEYGIMPTAVPPTEKIDFPINVLPVPIQEIVQQTHRCLNYTIDHIAASILFVASVAIGNSIIVEIKNEWVDKAILYIALVGKPGTNKSAPLRYALKPLFDRDRAALHSYEELYSQYETAMKLQTRSRHDLPLEPEYMQTVLSDFTTEVLMRQHKINQRGLAVFVDELIGFIKCFNKYRQGNDEQMWTQMFNGGSVIVNRVSSQPLNIEDTFVGVIGTIQPGLLCEFAKGKTESGFVDRWLFAYPEENVYPKLTDDELDPVYTKRWSLIVEQLFTLMYLPGSPHYRLNPEALAIYTNWFNALADRKNTASASFAEMATNMERYCIRVAIVLEALSCVCWQAELKEISAESIKGGIDLCMYFMGCAMKARKRFNRNPIDELNERQRKIYQELPVSFSTAEGLEIALNNGSCERAFKEWIKSEFFIHVSHGQYEKKYK